jgi:hypothetical protein
VSAAQLATADTARRVRSFAGTIFALCGDGNPVTTPAFKAIAGRSLVSILHVRAPMPAWLSRDCVNAQILIDSLGAAADRVRVERDLMVVAHRMVFAIEEDGVELAA